MKKKFATAINCMDGRVQIPVIEWLKKTYKVHYVDMITEAGPNKIIAENKETSIIKFIKKKIKISVNKHNSKIIAIIGHHGCAGNIDDKNIQIAQIYIAIKKINLLNLKAQVIGLWICENFKVHKVSNYIKTNVDFV